MKGTVYQQTQKVICVDSAELLKAFDVDQKKFFVSAVRMGFNASSSRGAGAIELILEEVDNRRD